MQARGQAASPSRSGAGPLHELEKAPLVVVGEREALRFEAAEELFPRERREEFLLHVPRDVDPERARQGFLKLEAFVKDSKAGAKPSDGHFATFWRLLLTYPELLYWETLWVRGRHQMSGSNGESKAAASIRGGTFAFGSR